MKHYRYTTQQGDTFDSIALDFYNSELYAGHIIKANPAYADMIVFDAGTIIKIPVIVKQKSTSLPPWKR